MVQRESEVSEKLFIQVLEDFLEIWRVEAVPDVPVYSEVGISPVEDGVDLDEFRQGVEGSDLSEEVVSGPEGFPGLVVPVSDLEPDQDDAEGRVFVLLFEEGWIVCTNPGSLDIASRAVAVVNQRLRAQGLVESDNPYTEFRDVEKMASSEIPWREEW